MVIILLRAGTHAAAAAAAATAAVDAADHSKQAVALRLYSNSRLLGCLLARPNFGLHRRTRSFQPPEAMAYDSVDLGTSRSGSCQDMMTIEIIGRVMRSDIVGLLVERTTVSDSGRTSDLSDVGGDDMQMRNSSSEPIYVELAVAESHQVSYTASRNSLAAAKDSDESPRTLS